MLVLALWPAAGVLQAQAHAQPQPSAKATEPDTRSYVGT
jgi:hypothetical protein